jgi:hypothetical protein
MIARTLQGGELCDALIPAWAPVMQRRRNSLRSLVNKGKIAKRSQLKQPAANKEIGNSRNY